MSVIVHTILEKKTPNVFLLYCKTGNTDIMAHFESAIFDSGSNGRMDCNLPVY